MKNYIICDTHCDSATQAFDNNFSLFENTLHIDFKRMEEYKQYTPFLAVFISPEYYDNPLKRCNEIIDYIYSQAQKYCVKICKNTADMNDCFKNNLQSAFISVEGGEVVTDISVLDTLYNRSVRMLSLTWNNDNHIGGGALGDGRGLSSFGKKVIQAMNAGKMIIDLSHANEKTFYDVMEITNKPVVLSHSNSCSLCPNPRNITDEQFKEIIRTNSVVGINLYPPFLTGCDRAKISDIIAHIEHFLSLGGEDNICIGTDFDGISYLPDEISGIEDIGIIFDELSIRGHTAETLQKIAYKNIKRIISICL